MGGLCEPGWIGPAGDPCPVPPVMQRVHDPAERLSRDSRDGSRLVIGHLLSLDLERTNRSSELDGPVN